MRNAKTAAVFKEPKLSASVVVWVREFSVVAAVLAHAMASGCAPQPSDVCVKYVQCQARYDEANEIPSIDLSPTYGEGGVCWQKAEIANACNDACESSNVSLKNSLEAAGEDVGPCE